jgi:6-phosphogluconolactonase (cycloisomerase 2 family)
MRSPLVVPSRRPFALPAACALSGLVIALATGLYSCTENSSGASLFDRAFTLNDPARFAYAVNSGDDTISSWLVAPLGRLQPASLFPSPVIGLQPEKIVAHPGREHFFVLGAGTSTVSVLSVDPTTGFLRPGAVATGLGFGPFDLAVLPAGTHVYTLARTSRQITALSFDPETGILTQIQITTTASQTPDWLLVDQRNRFLCAVDGEAGVMQTFKIEGDGTLTAGTTASLAPSRFGGADIDLAGQNIYLSVPNLDLVVRASIQAQDLFPILFAESLPTDDNPNASARPGPVRMHPSGRFLYVLNQEAGNIRCFTVDPASAALTVVGNLPSHPEAYDLVFEPTGRTGYLIDPPENRLIRYSWDFETGILTPREEIRTRQTPLDLAFLQADTPAAPVPQTLYVANERSSDLASLSVNPSQGTLTPLGLPVVAGLGPRALALDRRQRFLFVGSRTSRELASLSIAGDGSLFPIGAPTAFPGRPTALATEPTGQFLYVATQEPDQLRGLRIGEDGLLTPLAWILGLGDEPAALAADPTGRWLYAANSAPEDDGAQSSISIFSIDPRTGTLEPVLPGAATPGGAVSLAFAPNGARLYTALEQAGSALPLDVSPFLGTIGPVLPPTPTGLGASDIAIAPSLRWAWVAVRNSPPGGSVQLFDLRPSDGALVDLAEGTATPRQSVPAGLSPLGLLCDPSERFLYAIGNDSGTASVFGIGTDGSLTARQEIVTGLEPVDLALRVRID